MMCLQAIRDDRQGGGKISIGGINVKLLFWAVLGDSSFWTPQRLFFLAYCLSGGTIK